MPRAIGQRTVALIASFSVVISTLSVPATALASSHPTTDEDLTAMGIIAWTAFMGTIAYSEEAGEPLPMTNTSPSGALSLDSALFSTLAVALDTAVSDADGIQTPAELEQAILNADGTSHNGTTLTVGPALSVSGGSTIDVTLPVTLTHTNVDVPIVYTDGLAIFLSQNTAATPVDFEATGTFVFQYDGSAANPDERFAIVGSPTWNITADSSGPQALTPYPAQVGFTETNATGSADWDVSVEATFQDPDASGRITLEELVNTLPVDLIDQTWGAATSATVSVGLDATEGLGAGGPGATVSFSSAFPALPVPGDPEHSLADDVVVNLGGLEPFTNVSADDALIGLAHLAAVMASGEGLSDTPLPWVQASLSDVFSPSGELIDFVRLYGDGVIACGAVDTSPPSGSPDVANTVYCQAFLAAEPDTLTWSVASGKPGSVVAASPAGSAGINPTANASFTGLASIDDVRLSFTDTSAEPHEIAPRFRNAQELLRKLKAFGLAESSGALTVETNTGALQIPISMTGANSPINTVWELGDVLRSDTNLTGLVAAGGATTARITPTSPQAAATLGIILVDDPEDIGATSSDPKLVDWRFYVIDDANLLSIDNITLSDSDGGTVDADFAGTIGFVGIEASSANPTLGAPGPDPALSVSLPTGTTIPVSGTAGINNALLLRSVLEDVSVITSTNHLESSGSLTISVPDLGAFPNGTVNATWTSVTPESSPTVTSDGAAQDLAALDVFPTIEGINQGTGTSLTDPDRDWLTDLGTPLSDGDSVDGQILNLSDGSSCSGFVVHAAGVIDCVLAGGSSETPVWAAGDRYVITGNPLALRSILLDGIFQTAGALADTDAVYGEAFTPIDLSARRLVDPILIDIQEATALIANPDPTGSFLTCLFNPGSDELSDPIINCGVETDLTLDEAIIWSYAPAASLGPNRPAPRPGDTYAVDEVFSVNDAAALSISATLNPSTDNVTVTWPTNEALTLQELVLALEDQLGLPGGSINVSLADATHPSDAGLGPVPQLRTTMTVTDDTARDVEVRMPLSGPPSALDSVLLRSVDDTQTVSAATATSATIDLGVPLSGLSPTDVVVRSGTTTSASVLVEEDGFSLNVQLGALDATIGSISRTTGTHSTLQGSHTAAAMSATPHGRRSQPDRPHRCGRSLRHARHRRRHVSHHRNQHRRLLPDRIRHCDDHHLRRSVD